MRTLFNVAVLMAALLASPAGAKLPPLSDDAKAKAAETTAKAAWTDKVGLYQLCKSMDRVADAYRKSPKAAGKDVPGPTATPCVDPGPYATPVTPAASKPLEAAGAHSPSGTATSPPSTNATSAQMQGGVKK
jgi:hypothetical protein